MKTIIFAFVFTLTFVSSAYGFNDSYPGGGNPHDSLLFDGAVNYRAEYRNCKVIVKYIEGAADGMVEHTEVTDICSEKDTGIIVKAEKLKSDDVIHVGSKITTGDNSYLQLMFSDGSEARIGPNSELEIYQDFCENYTLGFRMGQMWLSLKKLLGSDKYNVKTQRAVIGNRGTQYSVDVKNDQEIVAVYESSVEVKINKIKLDKGEALKKLTDDYKAGKISKEEFALKAAELSKGIDPNTVKTSVILNAGEMCTVGGMLSDPTPIDPAASNWFDDANFFKK